MSSGVGSHCVLYIVKCNQIFNSESHKSRYRLEIKRIAQKPNNVMQCNKPLFYTPIRQLGVGGRTVALSPPGTWP